MAGIFASIGSNPFSSQVGQRIESATNGNLPSEDWNLIIEICDIINDSDEGPKDAIKAIKKRISNHKNYKSILYTLTLTEACVKNCGARFHKQVASKEFMSELTKLLGQKGQPSNLPQVVRDKVLSLIQTWSDAFKNAPELQNIKATYDSLKAQGYEFPAQDLDTLAPIFTPGRSELAGPPTQQREVSPREVQGRTILMGPSQPSVTNQHAPPTQQQQAVHRQLSNNTTGPINPSPEQLAKLRSELDIVDGNVRVLSQMLSELQPGEEEPNDYNLLLEKGTSQDVDVKIQELNKTCREMQKRVVELVDRIANEEVTGVLLQANDDLNNVFIRYDRYEKNRKAIIGEVTPQQTVDVNASPNQTTATTAAAGNSLIDFGDLTATTTTSPQKTVEDDEFDMFAQSRSSTFADSRNTGSTYDANREGIPEEGISNVMTAKGPYPNPPPAQKQPKTVEDDIEDVEEWLKGTDLAQLEADEQAAREAALAAQQPKHTIQTSENSASMSSSEFDRFLNDRAQTGQQQAEQQQQPQHSSQPAPARQMTNVAGERTTDEMFGL